VRLSGVLVENYAVDLAELLEQYGFVLEAQIDASTLVVRRRADARTFEIRAMLPTAGSTVEISEIWLPIGDDTFERSGYRYELIDVERGFRRAFHRHDDTTFERNFAVVVHEHCESPIGQTPCAHYFGQPVRDGYQGIQRLMAIWVSDPPSFADLPCLE
jgi:hypothetical protein